MREPVAIDARDVTRVYRSPAGSTEALHAVNASFAPGAIGALIGPSGSGKSTLLRLLAGIDRADGGSVLVGGVDVAELNARDRRRFRRDTAAYLAQRAVSNLIPHLTVREQLGANGVAAAERLDVAARLDARAGELSGGQQARAALAVGLSRETPVLLVDEPTAELDRSAAERVIDALAAAAADGRTIVVATHDPALVARADTVVDLAGAHEATTVGARTARTLDGAAVLAARAVTERYGTVTVVDAASLDVRAGELAVLLGRSGSGKSTLLMVLAGFIEATAGSVEVPGLRWRETAYVAQRFGLLPELSVAENVDLPSRLGGGTPLDVLETLGLDGLAARLPTETSVGQQQRVAVARAVASRPLALLADEPTSHQDAASAERVWAALQRACDDGTACLVATHDEDAAARADRVYRIEDGRVRPA